MKKSHLLTALALSLTIAGAVLAQDSAEAPKDKKAPAAGPKTINAAGTVVIKIPGVEWTDEQKEKVKEIEKEMAPKLKEAARKMEALLTAEQKKARNEAVKTAQAAGKKPQEIMMAVKEAINLTDDQKKQAEQVKEEMQTSQKEFFKSVMSLLTPEQQQQMIEKQKEMQKAKPAASNDKKADKE